jgi:hypothetical protein
MNPFSPVTDAELTRARSDPAFRQRMLEQSLETLLEGIKKLRRTAPTSTADVKQLREGVELAVRLAEILQNADRRTRTF